MQETERTNSKEEFKQGDIIRLDKTVELRELPKLSVVINADCDLAHKKFDGVIAYLPMYSSHEYLDIFWSPVFISQTIQEIQINLKTICNINQNDLGNLLSWIQNGEQVEIIDRLTKSFSLNAKASTNLSKNLEKLELCTDPNSNSLLIFQSLCQLENEPEHFAKKKIGQALSNLGDGHFFISELVSDARLGFIIRMRRIYSIDASRCYRSNTER